MDNFRDPFTPEDLSVIISDLIIATSDESSDALLNDSVPQVLRMLRQKMQMDVVFVSEFINGQRVFRFVDGNEKNPGVAEGHGDPLEESFCKLIVEGRLPQLIQDVSTMPRVKGQPVTSMRIGAHLSTPIVMNDGRIYGTLCCFSEVPNEALVQRDLSTLKHCAQLVARKLEAEKKKEAEIKVPDWSLSPK
jgi:GAF domain-containing protein